MPHRAHPFSLFAGVCLAGGVCLAAICVGPAPAAAQIMEDPRAVAMSAVRGDPVANSAVMHNPAGMSRAYLYAAEVFYARDAQSRNVAGVNIVDSKTQPKLAVGAAYGYQFTDSDADVTADGHDARLSLAHPVSDRLHVGLGLHYLAINRETSVEGATIDDIDGFTLDVGALIEVGSGLFIGAVGENLVEVENAGLPRRIGGGVGFSGEGFSAAVDVLADFGSDPDGKTKTVVAAGAEALIADVLPLRIGYEWNGATDEQWLGGGVGFMTRGDGANGGQITIAYRQNLDQSDQYLFTAGFVLFL